MAKYAILDINIFAIVILLFVLNNYKRNFKYGSPSEKLFAYLLISNISILLMDVLAISLWGLTGKFVQIILYFSQILFFISALLLTLLWLYYCIYRIAKSSNHSFFTKYLIPAPFVLCSIFIIVTVAKGYIFYVTPANEYVRGSLFHITTFIGYMYILGAFFLVIIKRKKLKKGELFPYVMLPLLPILLGIFQAYFYLSVTITWPATAIAMLGIHMHVLDNKTTTDHLTGLNNRMALDDYIKRIVKDTQQRDSILGIIMVDIDDFKNINDIYGHIEGDKAIKNAANILKSCLNGQNFIARFGGDEFIVVVKECTQAYLDKIIAIIVNETAKYNRNSHNSYLLEFSIGSSTFAISQYYDIPSMLYKVDRLMYDNKNSKKSDNESDDIY